MQFLSAEWLRAADAAVRASRFEPDVSLVIEQVVTGTPSGTVAYRVVVDDGSGRLDGGPAGPGDHVDVTITVPHALALDIATGRASAQQAFLRGDVRLGGDVTALIGAASIAATISEALAALPADAVP